ncbi:O-methyltransferase [Geotalea uraniireducens]|nr:hypothetical protein [Geotalea uraniireducens]
MSLSPHEIESQELGCRYAHGHTVVMGLGMGWVAINMALSPAVSKVTVIERDPEVIELFGLSRALHGLAAEIAGKIRIIRADALEWQPDEAVDFLYADIWRCLEEPQTLDDVRCMQPMCGRKASISGDKSWPSRLWLRIGLKHAPPHLGKSIVI